MSHLYFYTVPDSKPCQQAKELLSASGVSFAEIVIDHNEQAIEQLEKDTGQWSVPALVLRQSDDLTSPVGEVIVGFDRTAIERMLQHLLADR